MPDGDDHGNWDDETMGDRVSRLEAAIRQLQAELEWIKVALQGRIPADVKEKTSPPILGPVVVALIGAIGAIVAARPWA